MDFIGHDDAAISYYTHTGDEALKKAAEALRILAWLANAPVCLRNSRTKISTGTEPLDDWI